MRSRISALIPALLAGLLCALLMILLTSCGGRERPPLIWLPVDPTAPLSDSEFAVLSPAQQYRVINKMHGTLFGGVGFGQVFEIEDGLDKARIKGGYERFLSEFSGRLDEKLTEKRRAALSELVGEHSFSVPEQEMVPAMLHHFPVSRDKFDLWIAFVLANSIQYSPAMGLESAGPADTQAILRRLRGGSKRGDSIRDMAFEHMLSEENWRRFRSPEDNTREMMELFLGRFIDSEVPLASKACGNWSLNKDNELIVGFDENTDAMELLGREIITCDDFYQAVVDHPDFMPTLARMLTEIFFQGRSEPVREAIAASIAVKNPRTFREMFRIILFSREYLMNTERPRSFEESFYNFAGKIQWKPNRNFFRDTRARLADMNQPLFSNKLGRSPVIPLDTLSFSNFQRTMREKGALDQKRDEFNTNDGGWSDAILKVALPAGEYTRFLFLTVLEREPLPRELEVLNGIFESRGFHPMRDRAKITSVLLDYFSRLPDIYLFQRSCEAGDIQEARCMPL